MEGRKNLLNCFGFLTKCGSLNPFSVKPYCLPTPYFNRISDHESRPFDWPVVHRNLWCSKASLYVSEVTDKNLTTSILASNTQRNVKD